ncbi:hypothetical protein [Anaeromyxobacter diazotrophicus]|uniref:Mannitol repressor n=1 Tax=Anaeromyxobacter diazotrophicus TaxID=2590199 RepID=A0A7I9VKK1_9BACT|nr:hypothetical protein [Anaeromyxobacter diazotrophicus]GEJ56944.1 hypothetical protein AMYX_16850 [Anaeromyxobacter diazotrophicus]
MARSRVKLPEKETEFIELFRAETDRAAGVLAVSYLEAKLDQTLRTWFLDCSEMNRVLGSFSAKVDLAFGMGLLKKHHAADLRSLGEIRNRFAHHVLESNSFDVKPIRDLILDLSLTKFWKGKLPKDEFEKTSLRGLYLMAVRFILLALDDVRLARRTDEQVREDVHRIRESRKPIDPLMVIGALRRIAGGKGS